MNLKIYRITFPEGSQKVICGDSLNDAYSLVFGATPQTDPEIQSLVDDVVIDQIGTTNSFDKPTIIL